MNISLFYLSGNTTGGWVTYTAHLLYGLKMSGDVTPRLFKIGKNTEQKERSFGYGIQYRNVNVEDAVKLTKTGPTVIVALQKNYRTEATGLLEAGGWLVVHDPAEFANLKLTRCDRYIVIRNAVQGQVPGSTFVPHPYLRSYQLATLATGEWRACSICRIDFDKNTHILLDANRLLPEDHKIHIHGFENRLYTRFKLCPKYPEWEQSKCHYPRERSTAATIAHKATYTVDMSLIKGDGGGTQYSFLEAMDAGSINIIHRGWILPNDEMVPYPSAGCNCICVGSGEELAAIIQDESLLKEHSRAIAMRANVTLRNHSPRTVAERFVKLLRS